MTDAAPVEPVDTAALREESGRIMCHPRTLRITADEIDRLRADFDSLLAQHRSEMAWYTAEVERLRTEGTPGVMHEVDQAFYDLTIKERNYERTRTDRMTAKAADMKEHVADLVAKVQYLVDHYTKDGCCFADGDYWPQTPKKATDG